MEDGGRAPPACGQPASQAQPHQPPPTSFRTAAGEAHFCHPSSNVLHPLCCCARPACATTAAHPLLSHPPLRPRAPPLSAPPRRPGRLRNPAIARRFAPQHSQAPFRELSSTDTMTDPRDSSSYSIVPRIRYNTVGGVNGPLVILENVRMETGLARPRRVGAPVG